MERFSNLLNSYCKKFNYKYDRKGALFIDYMRGVFLENVQKIPETQYNIHQKPVEKGYCSKMEQWPWSSIHHIHLNSVGLVCRCNVPKDLETAQEDYHLHTVRIDQYTG